MATTATYHKRKLYIPKDVEEALELSDGDQTEIQILDEKSFKVSLKQKPRRTTVVERRLIDRILNRPLAGKLSKKHFNRADYYEED
jgi:bifunctional DNA-binding transcriptional regulator/antitoxin component of YhaV-PrlF toxin-antitoxin module